MTCLIFIREISHSHRALRMRSVFAGIYNGVGRFQTRGTFTFYKLNLLKSTVCLWRHNRGG